jgi:hypothetical protein
MRLPPEVEERIVPKFDWIRMLERAQPKVGDPPCPSPLFSHDALCSQYCRRLDAKRRSYSELRAATIKHIAVTVGQRADLDGRDAWCGQKFVAQATSRHKVTVIAALRHLEAKQLLYPYRRGGEVGMPRNWATIYYLTRPAMEVLVEAELVEKEIGEAFAWFARPGLTAG